MVETQEELSKKILEVDKAKTLFGIIARYVQDGYKQFECAVKIFDNKGFPSEETSNVTAIIMANRKNKSPINIYLNSSLGRTYGEESPVINTDITTLGGNPHNSIFEIQKLIKSPPNSPTPQDLAKLAKVIFAWIKEEMKKIP